MKIAMTGIFLNDSLEAYKFYTETLGFTSRMYMPEAMLAVVVSPEDENGAMLMLEPNQNPIAKTYQEGLYQAGIPCITLGTGDIQKEHEKLVAKGVILFS